jgi:hypothetical protein
LLSLGNYFVDILIVYLEKHYDDIYSGFFYGRGLNWDKKIYHSKKLRMKEIPVHFAINWKMESLTNKGDFESDCKKGTKESQKRTSFVAGGPNTTDEKWPK